MSIQLHAAEELYIILSQREQILFYSQSKIYKCCQHNSENYVESLWIIRDPLQKLFYF